MATLTLRPNAAGGETGLTPSDSGTNYENVDENGGGDNDSTYNYVYAPTSGGTREYDLYGLPDHTTESGTINHVKVYIRCKYYSGAGNAKVKILTEATEYEGSEETLTNSYVLYNKQWTTNPHGGDWTWTQIDALQAGVWLEAPGKYNKAHCTQVYVEVDYTPAITFIPTVTII